MMWNRVNWALNGYTFDASIELFCNITEISFHQIVSYAQWDDLYCIHQQYGSEYLIQFSH